MRPILLNGHDRALTQVKYNREGDLLFSVAKDQVPNVWYADNGERLGTYHGHQGTVWACDVDYMTERLVTASADCSMKLWDVETGKELVTVSAETPVRTCAFSVDGRKVMYSTDHAMGQPCFFRVLDLQQLYQEGGKAKPVFQKDIPIKEKRITALVWGPDGCFTAHANGEIVNWNIEKQCTVQYKSVHQGLITDLQFKSDYLYLISSSKDHSAQVIDCETMDVVKSFQMERPVNSAAISPTHDHVILGGGQEASQVTTTHGAAGRFDARLFHLVCEEEIGRIKGHFGPINTLAFRPDGKGYVSGGEDGFIRMHEFDDIYFDVDKEYFGV